MPVFLNTRGRSKLSIVICGRCSEKFPYDEVQEDPNYPGLYVCKDDLDKFDPWRLPARATEDITLEHARPDVSLAVGPMTIAINNPQVDIGGNSTTEIYTGEGSPIVVAPPLGSEKPSVVWSANTAYGVGNQVTVSNPYGFEAAGNNFAIFICMIPGTSGSSAPAWNSVFGVYTTDNTVVWMCAGLFLP